MRQNCSHCANFMPLPEWDHPYGLEDEGVCSAKGTPCYGDLVGLSDWCPHYKEGKD